MVKRCLGRNSAALKLSPAQTPMLLLVTYRKITITLSMTSEVAILNRHGIAIAADSAITIGQHRVWKTSNKIFSLSPRNDMAIMIYGGADFGGLPWETLIKAFKKDHSTVVFKTVSECSAAFIAYLDDERWFDDLQSQLCGLSVVLKEIEKLSDEFSDMRATDFRAEISAALSDLTSDITEHAKCLPNLEFDEFLNEFGEQISLFRKEKFSQHFPKYLSNLLNYYLFEYFTRENCSTDYHTGVVICGYGSEEYYPSLDEIIVDGRFKKSSRTWFARRSNLNTNLNRPAQIIPFAQRDMANLFMEGISSSYIGYFIEFMQQILNRKTNDIIAQFNGNDDEKIVERRLQEKTDEQIINMIKEDFEKYRSSKFIQPLMSNVNSLPRDEMAAMAEALVELTSLRRKIDSVVQSVAGPVDVAVISKADGVVWIKRKYYFDPERNPEFFKRKELLEDCHEED